MTANERLRPAPNVREAGPVLGIDLGATLRGLRAEPHPGKDGHRQISVLHRGPLRMVLFAFDAGGRLPEHRAPGLVAIHTLSGLLRVTTPGSTRDLATGEVLILDPDVPHDLEALRESDVLLSVHLTS